jgi:hypothetical protein
MKLIRDRAREEGAELVRRAALLEEGAVDQLDENAVTREITPYLWEHPDKERW